MDANDAISDSDLPRSITNHNVYGSAEEAATQLEAEQLLPKSRPPSVHLAKQLLQLRRCGRAMTSPSIKHQPHRSRLTTANPMLLPKSIERMSTAG